MSIYSSNSDESDYSTHATIRSVSPPVFRSLGGDEILRPTHLSESERVQTIRSKFDERVNTFLADVNVEVAAAPTNPFSTWLRAHYEAHARNGYVVSDNDYTRMKHYLLKKGQNGGRTRGLPPIAAHLLTYINRHKLRIEAVQLSNSSAALSRILHARTYSVTKEIVGDPDPEEQAFNANFRILIPFGRVERVIAKIHGDIHSGSEKVYRCVRSYFIGISREMVRKFTEHCPGCERNKRITEKQKRTLTHLKPIVTSTLFERWNLDLFKFDRVSLDGQSLTVCYVAQCVDHKSKLRFAEAIPTKEAVHVANF